MSRRSKRTKKVHASKNPRKKEINIKEFRETKEKIKINPFIGLNLHSYCSVVMVVGLGRDDDSNFIELRFTNTSSCGDGDGRDA
jgi:hypothetical protein